MRDSSSPSLGLGTAGGAAHSSAILALRNALPPPDLGAGMGCGGAGAALLLPGAACWPLESRGSLTIYFTALSSEALLGKAAWSRFRGFSDPPALPLAVFL